MTTSRTAVWLVAVGAVLWATDTIFRQPLTETLPAAVIVLYEHIILALVSIPILWRAVPQLRRLTLKGWLSLIFIGVGASALATVAFTQSFVYGNPTISILLQKVQPIIAILLAHLLLREHIRRTGQFWFFTIVAFIGAYILSFEDLTPFRGIGDAHTLAIVYALVAAALWGSATVFGRYVLRTIEPTQTTALRFLIALPALVVLVFLQGHGGQVGDVTVPNLGNLLFMALIPGFLAMFIYYRGLKRAKASIATVAELAFPLAATIINWILLDYTLTLIQIMGGLILVLAIFQMNRLNAREQQSEVPVNEALP